MKSAKIHVFGGFFDVGVGDPLRAQPDVALDGSGKKKRILQDHAKAAAKLGKVHFLYVHAVDPDSAFLHVVEAQAAAR